MNGLATSTGNESRIGAGSDFVRFRKIDGRSEIGRRLRSIQRELIDHLGGPDRVTAPQRLLIERTAIDVVRLELLDHEMLTGTFSAHDGRVAHALRNTVRLALRELGMGPKKPPPGKTLADVMAEISAAEAAARRPVRKRAR